VEELRARRDQLDYVIEQETRMRNELEREMANLQVRQRAGALAVRSHADRLRGVRALPSPKSRPGCARWTSR